MSENEKEETEIVFLDENEWENNKLNQFYLKQLKPLPNYRLCKQNNKPQAQKTENETKPTIEIESTEKRKIESTEKRKNEYKLKAENENKSETETKTKNKSTIEANSKYPMSMVVEIREPISKNGIISMCDDGLKSLAWGKRVWKFLFSLAFKIQCKAKIQQVESEMDRHCCRSRHKSHKAHRHLPLCSSNIVIFYFKISFGSCGPCGACRKSHVEFVNRPVNNIIPFIQNNELPLWCYVIKNNVNNKLDKPLVPYKRVKDYYLDDQNIDIWEECFWYWLYIQTINYPVDVSWSAISETPALLQRLRDYVTLIEQIKNFLPQSSPLYKHWIRCYFDNPPTVYTFQSRESLFMWTYNQQRGCKCTKLTLHETGLLYEQLRAQSCKNEVISCK